MQLALALGGAAATSLLGIGPQLGFIVGNLVYNWFLAPPIRGPRVNDPGFPDAAFGRPLPLIDGTAPAALTLIDSSDLIRKEHSSGGFGSGGPRMITETVHRTMDFAAGEGPLDLIMLWENETLILDRRSTNTGPTNDGLVYHWYRGDETQLPDPWMEELHGAGNVAAYRGSAHLVIFQRDLTKYGGTVPSYRALLATGLTSYPKVALSNIPGYGSWFGMARDFERDYVYAIVQNGSGDNAIVKYDALSGAVIAYNTAPLTPLGETNDNMRFAGLAVDRDGYVYLQNRAVGNRFFRIDPNTLQGTVKLGDVFASINPEGICVGHNNGFWNGVPFGAAFGPYIFCAWAGGDAIVMHGTGGTLKILVQETDFTGDDLHWAAWDKDGHMWVVGGSTLRKWRVSGTSAANATVQELATYSLSAFSGSKNWIVYVPVEDFLAVMSSTGVVIIIDPVDGTVIRSMQSSFSNSQSHANNFKGWLDGTRIAYGAEQSPTNVDQIGLFDLVSGQEILFQDEDYGAWQVPEQALWEPLTESVWMVEQTQTAAWRVFLPRVDGASTTLRAILERHSLLTNQIVAADFDFTAQTQVVRGNRFAGESAAESIQLLRPFYGFDVISSDWKVKGINRGGASAVTIDELDLGAADGGEFPDTLEIDRIPDEQLARRIEFYSMDPDRNWEVVSEPAWREGGANSAEAPLEFSNDGLVMTADERATAAWRFLLAMWRNRDLYRTTALPKHMRLDPTDVVTFTRGGVNHLVRLTPKTALGAQGIVTLEAAAEDPSIYSFTATGAGASQAGFTAPTVAFAPASELYALDLALLPTDDDSNLGHYLMVARRGSGSYQGAVVEKFVNGTWTEVATITKQAPAGFALGTLPNLAAWNVFDDVSTLDVTIVNGLALTNASETDVLQSWANLAAVGRNLIQFKTATQLSGNTWRLGGGILQGRLGSEVYIGTGAAGDPFVMLTRDNVRRVAAAVGEIGQTLYFRARTVGSTRLPTEIKSLVFGAERHKPYAGYAIAATRDGSNNLTVTWLTRSRQDVAAFLNHPIGEASESYDAEFRASAGGAVLRTKTVSTPSVSYSASEQTTDGITPGNPVHVTLYQKSGFVTTLRGHAAAATV